MKKNLLTIITLCFIMFFACGFLSACGDTSVVKVDLNFIVDNEVYATISTGGNETITMPQNPTKEGFIFDGWYWDKDTWTRPFTANSLLNEPLSSNMSVYAKWKTASQDPTTPPDTQDPTTPPDTQNPQDPTTPTQQSFTVTFNSMGGSAVSNQTIENNNFITEPTAPTKTDYVFLGWYTDANYTTQWNFSTNKVTANITLYAKWQDNVSATFIFNSANEIVGLTNYGKSLSRIEIPSEYNGTNVTSIGHWAFDGCSSLASIIIPNSVTSIGSYAFFRCSNLTSINIPYGPTSIGSGTFANCPKLESITIPSSVTSIGDWAFDACSRLKSITIPNSVISIEFGAFRGCSSLTSITIPDGVKSIGPDAFFNCSMLESITIANSVTSIGSRAFYDCFSLTSVTIPNSLTSIGPEAFDGCSRLNYNIYDNAEYLGNDSNSYVILVKANLKTITSCEINENCKLINSYAFKFYTNLKSVTIPNSVNSIGYGAFYYCWDLKSITIPNSVTSIEGGAFYHSGLTSITIPNSVTSIENETFSGCSKLADVTIPNSVNSIGHSAFEDCSSLNYNIYDNAKYLGNASNPYLVLVKANSQTITSCAININCKVIADDAFEDCSKLTSVTIPNGVTSIGDDAFLRCFSLTKIYYKGTAESWKGISIGANDTCLTSAEKYYYSECIHDNNSNQWTYDKNGNITTEIIVGNWVIDKQPTCTETGLKHGICSVCGNTVELIIPALGHNINEQGCCPVCNKNLGYVVTNDVNNPFNETNAMLTSTNHSDSSSSFYVITAKANIVVTFEYKVSSENNYDKFYILHNTTEKLCKSGTNNSYTSFTINLNVGDTLTFKYTKDNSTSAGDDCCYIKNLTITLASQ